MMSTHRLHLYVLRQLGFLWLAYRHQNCIDICTCLHAACQNSRLFMFKGSNALLQMLKYQPAMHLLQIPSKHGYCPGTARAGCGQERWQRPFWRCSAGGTLRGLKGSVGCRHARQGEQPGACCFVCLSLKSRKGTSSLLGFPAAPCWTLTVTSGRKSGGRRVKREENCSRSGQFKNCAGL
jgi:hypothetical protein